MKNFSYTLHLFLLSIITPFLACELVFINTFSLLITGEFENIKLWQLVVSLFAPIASVVYFVLMWFLSINIANSILKNIVLGYNTEGISSLKLLIEDYNMAVESAIMPSLLFLYRLSLVISLSGTAFVTYASTINLKDFAVMFTFAFLLIGTFIIVRFVGKKFSLDQNARMHLITQITDRKAQQLSQSDLKILSEINLKLYSKKLIIGIFGFAAKPLIDFTIVALVLFMVLFNDGVLQDGSKYLGLALIGYRMMGPAINLSSNVTQINFAWASLSPIWRKHLLELVRRDSGSIKI